MNDPNLAPLLIHDKSVKLDGWDDPAKGRLQWRTLFSKGLTQSDTITCGVAELGPGDWLIPHRHAAAEVCYILEGTGVLTLEGKDTPLKAGDALFIPSMAEHGSRQTGEGMFRTFYVFAVDSFEDVTYFFPEVKG